MSTALAEREPAAIPAAELTLIKQTVANGASDAELKLFLFDCQRRGVHPLDKLLHFTKRGGKYTPVTSIDFMRSQAAMSGEMAGSDDPVFTPDFTKTPTGIESATVTVYRITQGQRFAYSATARWSEYCPDNAPMWRRMPHTMLGKCAEALALRKAFPQQLAGLYSREEMDQADSPAPVPQPVRGGAVAPTRSAGDSERRSGGTEMLGDAASSPDSIIDTTTGEEHPTPPGFFYVAPDSYRFSNGWHEFRLLNYDTQGGSILLSTKKQIGAIAQQAEIDRVPVRVTTSAKKNAVGEAYLDSITVYKPETNRPDLPEPSVMVPASEIPFLWLLPFVLAAHSILA